MFTNPRTLQCVFHHLQAVLKVIVFEGDEKAHEAIESRILTVEHIKQRNTHALSLELRFIKPVRKKLRHSASISRNILVPPTLYPTPPSPPLPPRTTLCPTGLPKTCHRRLVSKPLIHRSPPFSFVLALFVSVDFKCNVHGCQSWQTSQEGLCVDANDLVHRNDIVPAAPPKRLRAAEQRLAIVVWSE
jgi:hypothetical protein